MAGISKLSRELQSQIKQNVGPDGRAILTWKDFALNHKLHYTQVRRWRDAMIRQGLIPDTARYGGVIYSDRTMKPDVLIEQAAKLNSGELHYDALIAKLGDMVEKSSDATAVRALQLLLEEKRSTQSHIGAPKLDSEDEKLAIVVQILRSFGPSLSQKAMETAFNAQENSPDPTQTDPPALQN